MTSFNGFLPWPLLPLLHQPMQAKLSLRVSPAKCCAACVRHAPPGTRSKVRCSAPPKPCTMLAHHTPSSFWLVSRFFLGGLFGGRQVLSGSSVACGNSIRVCFRAASSSSHFEPVHLIYISCWQLARCRQHASYHSRSVTHSPHGACNAMPTGGMPIFEQMSELEGLTLTRVAALGGLGKPCYGFPQLFDHD